eukprot:CAMPEP_0117637020 /NCGR_PEP_ID=MMETSP0802-20121206/7081_1 /TAXON_ID=38833 /ORGANISM="Micromonas sp., Strain CCMP2099" /LENGTH=138 /DNA_ID=CAMNT_0005441879 /DNA_START=354 /DNA_END=770 /DNA_ORIENTATION=+
MRISHDGEPFQIFLRELQFLRHVQTHHQHVGAASVQQIRRQRVAENVSLRARIDVAVGEERTAKVYYLVQFLNNRVSVQRQRHRQVRGARQRDDGDFAWKFVRHLYDELCGRDVRHGFAGNNRHTGVPEPVVAVHEVR